MNGINLMNNPLYYSGIGSRTTPAEILTLINQISTKLSQQNYICRTGYAEGADKAFYSGSSPNVIVYQPENITLNNGGIFRNAPMMENWSQALEIGKQFHPAWSHLGKYAQQLIARNGYQVLGDDLSSPCEFIICWTPDGATKRTTKYTGGTGQAIRIANHYNIPVYNLADASCRNTIDLFLNDNITF